MTVRPGRCKFAPPLLPKDLEKIVGRSSVSSAIAETVAATGVAEIVAPAGYGKTTAALSWIAETGVCAAWVTIDPYDDAPARFYRRLCAALAALHPGSRALRGALSSPSFGDAPVENTIDALMTTGLRRSAKDAPLLLVLDNVHLITNRDIVKSLPCVINRLPKGDAALLIGRGPAVCSAASFMPVGPDLLRFSEREAKECFANAGRAISREEALNVARACDGWPAAVRAMAEGNAGSTGRAKEKILADCIRRQLWEPRDDEEKNFLLGLSVLDDVAPDLAALVSGRTEKEERARLDALVRENPMIRRTPDGQYVLHALLLDFLRARWEEEAFDGRGICDAVADHYIAKGDDYRGAHYALRGKNGMEKVLVMLRVRPEDRVRSVAEHVDRLEQYVLSALPDEIMKRCPFLHINFAWHAYLTGDARALTDHLDRLYGALSTIAAEYGEFFEMAAMACCMDHRLTMAELASAFLEFAQAVGPEASEKPEDGKIQVSSITQNLPLIHRSMRDFSHLALADGGLEGGIRDLRAVFGAALRENMSLIEGEMEGGLRYERNELDAALSLAKGTDPLYEESGKIAELGFAARMLRACALNALGRDDEARACREGIERYLAAEGATYLQPNFLAYRARLRLQDGEKAAAAEWLDNYFVHVVSVDGRLPLFRIWQHMTTARALMVAGDMQTARGFLQRVSSLARDFARPLDEAEATTLLAILEWYRGVKSAGLRHLEEALTVMQEYGFVRVFADEGASLLPLLRRLADKRKKEGGGRIDPAYLDAVERAARFHAKRHAGIVAAMQETPIRLPKQQARILALLAEGLGYAEIAKETGLAPSTVKGHCTQLYGKLNAVGAGEAVSRARKIGLIAENPSGKRVH